MPDPAGYRGSPQPQRRTALPNAPEKPGKVTAALKVRHRHTEFLAFSKQIEWTYRSALVADEQLVTTASSAPIAISSALRDCVRRALRHRPREWHVECQDLGYQQRPPLVRTRCFRWHVPPLIAESQALCPVDCA